jgi:hypothetical protein
MPGRLQRGQPSSGLAEPFRGVERPRGMRRLVTIALIALTTAGCMGSSSGGSAPRTGITYSGAAPATRMAITYTVDNCPPATPCKVLPVGTGLPQAVRELTCSPNGGDYSDPASACRALNDIETKQHRQQSGSGPVVVCRCVMSRGGPTAVGYYNGKRRTILLDGCSLCGLHGIGHDLAVLLPGAQR